MKVWSFNSPNEIEFSSKKDYEHTLSQLTESIHSGKSRFGWSTEDKNNLNDPNYRYLAENSRQLRLLEIEVGDWIVHINLPKWGNCIAVEVTENYDFDEGIGVTYKGRDSSYSGRDFKHCFQVNTAKIVEFSRTDPNVLPEVNLRPRSRLQRIYQKKEFIESLRKIRKGLTLSIS